MPRMATSGSSFTATGATGCAEGLCGTRLRARDARAFGSMSDTVVTDGLSFASALLALTGSAATAVTAGVRGTSAGVLSGADGLIWRGDTSNVSAGGAVGTVSGV